MKRILMVCVLMLMSIYSYAQVKSVEITAYNSGFALVKEVRNVDISKGVKFYDFMDVAALIEPESLLFKSITDSKSIAVLEQNYKYDLMNAQSILSKMIGQRVTLKDGVTGTLLSSPGVGAAASAGLIVKLDSGKIAMYPSIEAIDTLPGDLIARPTLNIMIDSDNSKKHDVELSYITRGISWNADYVCLINADDNKVDLNGWVTLVNNCGTTFKNANLSLVAGDVKRAPQNNIYSDAMFAQGAAGIKMKKENNFEEQSLFEYHLYKLGRNTDIFNNENKQVSLLNGSNVNCNKKFVYAPRLRNVYYCLNYDNGARAYATSDQYKIAVSIEFLNSKDNGLGMPLPKGNVKVYKADKEGNQQFIGEDKIDHTPKDEKITLDIGNAFDILGEYKLTNYKRISNKEIEETYEVTIRNHKSSKETVTFYENAWGDWNITSTNAKYNKVDAQTIEFPIEVSANGTKIINYTIRTKY